MQKSGFQQARLAAFPVGLNVVHHQQSIHGVDLVAKAVVGQCQEAAIAYGVNARETLHRLTLNWQKAT